MSSPVAMIPMRPPRSRVRNGTPASRLTATATSAVRRSAAANRRGGVQRRPVAAAYPTNAVSPAPPIATGCSRHGQIEKSSPATHRAPNTSASDTTTRSSAPGRPRSSPATPATRMIGTSQSTPIRWVASGSAHAAASAAATRSGRRARPNRVGVDAATAVTVDIGADRTAAPSATSDPATRLRCPVTPPQRPDRWVSGHAWAVAAGSSISDRCGQVDVTSIHIGGRRNAE